MLKAR